MTDRPRPRDRRFNPASRYAPALLAVALFATSMLVASSFRSVPGPDEPGPSAPYGAAQTEVPWAGPDLYGIFAACNPACDLEVAVEGIGRRLTMTDSAVDESAPSIAPDRARVAYRCAAPGVEPGGPASARPEGLGSLCLIDTIPPEEQEATPPPATTVVSDPEADYDAPAWSPDGSIIAVTVRTADGPSQLAFVDPATAAVTSVTTDVGDVANPAWSADGSLLGFSCGTGEGAQPSTRFCTRPAEGGMVTAFGEVAGSCGTPAFMPDGAHLGVVCVGAGGEGADLYVLSLDEPHTAQLTSGGLIAPEGIRRVVFSPDQQHAFVRRDDALWSIGIPGGAWSLPPMPPLHGDFDLQVLD